MQGQKKAKGHLRPQGSRTAQFAFRTESGFEAVLLHDLYLKGRLCGSALGLPTGTAGLRRKASLPSATVEATR